MAAFKRKRKTGIPPDEHPTTPLDRPPAPPSTMATAIPSAPLLNEFARATDFSRESFGADRTLVAVWPPKQLFPETGRHARKPGSFSGVGGLP